MKDMRQNYDMDERNHREYECTGIIHVIQQGDTLYHLSQKYRVSVAEIMYRNPYLNVYNLKVGDEICIPTILVDKKKLDYYNQS